MIKYFLKRDDNFMFFWKKLVKALINYSYMNEKICGSTKKTRKGKISHTLDNSPTYATGYNKNGLNHKI